MNAEQRRGLERAGLPPSVLAAADAVIDACAESLAESDVTPAADDYEADDYDAEIGPCDLCGQGSARQYGGLYDGLCAACQASL